jgi:hypothetical protein
MNQSLNRITLVILAGIVLTGISGCEETSDDIQRVSQENMVREATQQTGMPAITNFTERKQLKRILELRDRANYRTYTYVMVPGTGQRKFLCNSIGYGIPYATQYTNPQKVENWSTKIVIPQADPNGLFSPPSADATWVTCVNPEKGTPDMVYEENRITVSPFKLPE